MNLLRFFIMLLTIKFKFYLEMLTLKYYCCANFTLYGKFKRDGICNIRSFISVDVFDVRILHAIIHVRNPRHNLVRNIGSCVQAVSERSLSSYGGSRCTFVAIEKSLPMHPSPALCSPCWNARPASPVDRRVGEREQEGVSFKLEIASSVAMMGRKLGAKQNAKERSLERGRDDERRETRAMRGRDGTRRNGEMRERRHVSIFYLCARLAKMQSARVAGRALAVIRKTASRYCDAGIAAGVSLSREATMRRRQL